MLSRVFDKARSNPATWGSAKCRPLATRVPVRAGSPSRSRRQGRNLRHRITLFPQWDTAGSWCQEVPQCPAIQLLEFIDTITYTTFILSLRYKKMANIANHTDYYQRVLGALSFSNCDLGGLPTAARHDDQATSQATASRLRLVFRHPCETSPGAVSAGRIR